MRKIFIALAASLLITIGSAVRITQLAPRDLKEGNGKSAIHRERRDAAREHRDEHWEGAEEGHHWEHEV